MITIISKFSPFFIAAATKTGATKHGKCPVTTAKLQTYLSEYLKQAKNRGGGCK